MHYAADNGHLSLAEILLEKGADVNEKDKVIHTYKRTNIQTIHPLHIQSIHPLHCLTDTCHNNMCVLKKYYYQYIEVTTVQIKYLINTNAQIHTPNTLDIIYII